MVAQAVSFLHVGNPGLHIPWSWDCENSLCLCNCACLGDRQESAWASCGNRLPTSWHAGSQHQGR